MKKYNYVFIVVTYKNGNDLYDFINSLNSTIKKYKVIVVNSFYDNETKNNINKISQELNLDFINIDNRGYGYGNNIGIDYAIKKYMFDYLVVCNSDVIVKKLSEIDLINENTILGPKIEANNGKMQNPYWVKKSKLLEYLMYLGRKKKRKSLMWINIIINKILRQLFLLFNKNKCKKIYAVHGSFVLFTRDVVLKLNPIYDENMFLYNEEAYLAYRCRKEKIQVLYYPKIQVFHKEDGSTGGIPHNIDTLSSDSYIYYYEKYIKKKRVKKR